jgi:type IV pilus assembly protein PilV
MKKINYQHGATLIEILISVVILALGLLGLAGLQVNSLQYQKTSSSRSEATQAAYDIGERIRSNWPLPPLTAQLLPAASEQIFNTERAKNESNYSNSLSYAAAASPSAVNQGDIDACLGKACDANAMAKYDVSQWIQNLQGRLPGGAGSISVIPAGATQFSAFDVTVMWKEQGFKLKDTSCPDSVDAPTGVRCLTLRVTI